VTVLPRGRTLEIYNQENVSIAPHPLGFKTRSLVYLPDQFKGFTAETTHIAPQGRCRQIEETSVEVRILDDYAELMANA
jgi:hypothetical protein